MSIRKSLFLFENLDVYKKSLSFSIEVCKLASKFHFQYNRIKGQFIGASISIPLNIAEGNGRQSVKDRANFYKIARSSGFECIPLIEICLSLDLINEETANSFRDQILEISKMLSGLIKSIS